MITIIDYGAGNLHSVQNAFERFGEEIEITNDPDKILKAEKVVLPGVGSFGDAMEKLRSSNLLEAIKETVKKGTPFLGICLGLQLLFEESEESPGAQGLGIFKGKCVKFRKENSLKIPHMGWNDITRTKESKILKNLGENPYLYFVHSYYIVPKDETIISATTNYPDEIPIAVEKENVFALQFHPEKSGNEGMKILENFIKAEV